MTIADHLVLFDFHEIVQIERSFTVKDTNGRHLILELKDDSGETDTITIKRMPCGLMVDAKAVCSAFCKNLHGEFSEEDRRALLRLVGGGIDDDTIEELIRRSFSEPQKPFFPSHSFFREVFSN